MDNTYDKFERVSKALNLIRQEAQCKDGYIIIRPNTKEWDAIFFAEEFLKAMARLEESIADQLEILSDLTRSV